MRAFSALLMLVLLSVSVHAADTSAQTNELKGLADRLVPIECAIDKTATDDTGLVKLRIDLDNLS